MSNKAPIPKAKFIIWTRATIPLYGYGCESCARWLAETDELDHVQPILKAEYTEFPHMSAENFDCTMGTFYSQLIHERSK